MSLTALMFALLLSLATPTLTAAAVSVPNAAEQNPAQDDKGGTGSDQQNGANPAPNQEPGPKQGVIKPPPTGDTGINTTVPNPNAGTDKDVIPPPGTPPPGVTRTSSPDRQRLVSLKGDTPLNCGAA
jgi:hypothetical protein